MSRHDYPHSWGDARAFLDAGYRRPVSRKLARNTYVEERPDGSIAVRLHATDVVTFHENGSATIRCGGWWTYTTRSRVNLALGYSADSPLGNWGIGSERGRRYLFFRVEVGDSYDYARYRFRDGVAIWPDGTTNAEPCPRRPYKPHPHPRSCRCIVHAGRREGAWYGRRSWTPPSYARHEEVPAHPYAVETVPVETDPDAPEDFVFDVPEGIEPLRASEYARRFQELLRRPR